MKKFLTAVLIALLLLIIATAIIQNTEIYTASSKITEQEIAEYSNYYFDKLNSNEKNMYAKLDKAVKAKKPEVIFFCDSKVEETKEATRVITSYFYDNPEYYYISNSYTMKIMDFKLFKCIVLKLDYIVDKSQIEIKNQELELAITDILNSVISSNMSDFEKELAIHDALAKKVKYYEFNEVEKIPGLKHTAYGALVEKEAVCDGYSKAFKLLLDRVNVESIIINGEAEKVAHAWNLVKLDNNYYNVDLTSNNVKDKFNKYVTHTYFNVTDEFIAKTHKRDTEFEHPACTQEKYNYYKYKGLYIDYDENTYTKLKKILSTNKGDVLELQLDERYHVQTIVDTLYSLNFGSWKSQNKKSVSYNKLENTYIFIK